MGVCLEAKNSLNKYPALYGLFLSSPFSWNASIFCLKSSRNIINWTMANIPPTLQQFQGKLTTRIRTNQLLLGTEPICQVLHNWRKTEVDAIVQACNCPGVQLSRRAFGASKCAIKNVNNSPSVWIIPRQSCLWKLRVETPQATLKLSDTQTLVLSGFRRAASPSP